MMVKRELHPDAVAMLKAVHKGSLQALLQLGDWWEEHDCKDECKVFQKLLAGVRYCIRDEWQHRKPWTRLEAAKAYVNRFEARLGNLGYKTKARPRRTYASRVVELARAREWVSEMAHQLLAYMRAQQPKTEETSDANS